MTFAAQGASSIIYLASTVILARLLSPQDYGIIAMVAAVTSFAGLFGDMGLSAAAIQKKDIGQRQQSNLFWLNVAMGAMLTTLVASASPLIVWFYQKPEVFWVAIALSFTFVITSLGTQNGVALIRSMSFGYSALAKIIGACLATVVSVTLALNGFSYWSLVWGNLSGAACTTAALFFLSPFRPGLPSRGSGVRDMLRFGAHITAFDFVNYFQRNLDNILVGRYWGSEALGFYSRAYSLLMFPINAVRGPINSVAFTALSKLQTEPEAFRSYYLKTTSLLAMVSMPLTAFMFVASQQIIELAYGRQWLAVSPIFSYLALAAFMQPTAGFVGSLLLSLGQGRRYLQCGLFNAVILCISFLVGVFWGVKGVAIGYAIGNYVILYPWLWWAYRESPVSFSDFLNACSFPVIVSLLSGGVALLLKAQLPELNLFAQLFVLGLGFCVVPILAGLFTPIGRRYGRLLSGLLISMKGKIAG